MLHITHLTFSVLENPWGGIYWVDGVDGIVQDVKETKMSLTSDVALMGTFLILLHWFEHLTQPHFRCKNEFGPKGTQISEKFANLPMI